MFVSVVLLRLGDVIGDDMVGLVLSVDSVTVSKVGPSVSGILVLN